MGPKGVCVKGQLSIPRAELNAAFDLAKKVLDVEQALDLPKDICLPTILYSDSQDVLAWVKNGTTKEPISRYVASRVTTITNITSPSQWVYIPTKDNPADIGTRPVSADNLKASPWLTGPPFLHHENPQTPTKPISPTPFTAYPITDYHRPPTTDRLPATYPIYRLPHYRLPQTTYHGPPTGHLPHLPPTPLPPTTDPLPRTAYRPPTSFTAHPHFLP